MSAVGSDDGGSVDLPVPQTYLVEARLQGVQPGRDLEVALGLRDRKQPQELDVPITDVARLQVRPVGVGKAGEQVVTS